MDRNLNSDHNNKKNRLSKTDSIMSHSILMNEPTKLNSLQYFSLFSFRRKITTINPFALRNVIARIMGIKSQCIYSSDKTSFIIEEAQN